MQRGYVEVRHWAFPIKDNFTKHTSRTPLEDDRWAMAYYALEGFANAAWLAKDVIQVDSDSD